MHNNHYYLLHLSKALGNRLEGMELATCFSQNRDELVLGFCHEKADFWIKALAHSAVSALSFPDDFQRAKQNSVDLFKEAIGEKIIEAWVFDNERAFALLLTNGYSLVFKLFGNRSNIILYKEEEVCELFRKQQKQDLSTKRSDYHRPIEQTYEAYVQQGLRKTYPTLDKETIAYLEEKGFKYADAPKQWEMLQALIMELEKPNFYVGEHKGLPKLWLFEPLGIETELFNDPIEAGNAFFYRYARVFYLEKEQQEALKSLKHRIKSSWSYIEKTSGKLEELLVGSRYEEMGHILMANLHQIPARAKQATLHDFYKDTEVTIKLNPALSPQKNAENFYRKSKNQKIEVTKLQENLAKKETLLETYQRHLEAIEAFDNVRDLRKYLKQHKLSTGQEQQEAIFPFRRFEFEGFEIWVGKNAKNNDLLTQQYAFKEDLWLHARDVTGSHVVLKYQAGKGFPAQVIEKAASLAAYYSVRKNDSLCPVIYTPKKYVRKTKGLAPGMVLVDKEEVLMIEPAPFNESLG